MIRVLIAVLFSGAASLIYQLSWTRRLADVTSATAYAQAIVLAVFFAGLGIGAVFPGRLAARARKPLLGYCLLELGALASSLASIPLFTQLDRFRGALSRAGAAPGTALAGELFLACVFLLVPTVLMGASLPFALEHAERIAGQAVRRRFVPLAYGINTFGAALGCAFAGYFLIERWGLARTTAVGAGLSFAAAAIALSAARQAPSTIPRIETGEDAEDKPSNVPRSLIAAAAAAGFVGVGAEVVWLRLFSLIILNTVYAFTQVLIAVLLGIVLGSVFARSVASRVSGSRALLAAGLAQAGAAIGIASVGPLAMLLSGRTEIETAIATGRSVLGGIGLVIALCIPVALNAATLPLLVQSQRGTGVSRSFGSFYAANTGGSVLGSLLCGFVVIPALGTTGASGCLEAVSLAIAFALVWVGSEAKRDAFATLAPGLVVVVLHLVLPTAGETMCQSRLPAGTRILELREGIASNVMVTESQAGQRRLWINSSWVAGTGGGHTSLGLLPALFVRKPRRAVGIALGTGQTFAALFAHGVEELHVVEINPDVIRLSRHWFADENDHLFEHPGVVIHQEDGRAFLRSRDDRFDLVVLEPLQSWSAGTSSLYSREFYEEARRVLSPSGVVAQWIPFYGQGVDETRAMVRTAIEVFPNASLWLDEHDGILLLSDGPMTLPPKEMEQRIADRGISVDLANKSIRSATDVMSLLVLGPEGLARWAGGATILSDDRPFLEFAAARQIGQESFAPIVASIAKTRSEGASQSAAGAGGLSAEAQDADAAGSALIADALAEPQSFPLRAKALESAISRLPRVSVLRARYRSVIDQWLSVGIAAGATSAEMEQLLLRGLRHDDEYGEAMLNLAIIEHQRGNASAARAWVERASHIDRVKFRALQMLKNAPPE